MKLMLFNYISKEEKDTYELGIRIGQNLLGGEIVILDGDLGSGKTVLAKGIAKGIGSGDDVSSPTFTVEHIYTGSKLTMHHYDLYRLGELGLMSEELQEVLNDNTTITVIEWPQAAEDDLYKNKLVRIKFDKDSSEENMRHIQVDAPESIKHVLNSMKDID